MGRRYFCDYCNKTFIDDIEARKKHLNSVHHTELKRQHYERFKDLKTIYNEESVKIPCSRFLGMGSCYFNSNCKYSHYTKEELWEIKRQILAQEELTAIKSQQENIAPTVAQWIDKYTLQKSEHNRDDTAPFWSYPELLENRLDLPPSLRKFKPEDFLSKEFSEWG